jgi:Asp-tRNA(Asn)/Glu-tRNA(Gln) amidotransferase A subunit family amidase
MAGRWSSTGAVLAVLIMLWSVGGQDCFSVVETPIRELQAALANEEITCIQLVQSYLDRIEAYDQAGPKLNSFITVNPQALEEAASMDDIPQEARQPLHCIPFVAKDLFNAVGMPTTAGSVVLADSYGSGDAFIVGLLKDEGALLMGKVNLAELAVGFAGGTNSSLGGQTLNSYALDRSPQGSSGGTATSVAASFAAFGLGTDFGIWGFFLHNCFFLNS